MPFADGFRDNILTDNFDTPTDLKLALFQGDPLGAGTEISGNNYSRQTITFGAVAAGTGTRRQVQNNNAPSFSCSGGNWGSIDYVAVYTNGGTLLWGEELDTAETINDGGTFDFPAGNLTIFMEDAP